MCDDWLFNVLVDNIVSITNLEPEDSMQSENFKNWIFEIKNFVEHCLHYI